MKELVSVIVPVYNVEEYLERCIKSLLKQTYDNLEIILVDDGSTDNSPKICDEYAKKDKRIKVIHKRNGGLSDARNKGFEKSKGKYISFIDSDDFIHSKMIEVLYNNLKQYDADVSVCNYRQTSSSKTEKINMKEQITKCFSKEETYNNLFNEYYIQTEIAWNKLYKREIWNDLKYPKGKVHEDAFVIHHIIDKAEKIVYTNLKLYYYFEREGSITKVFNEKRLDAIEALRDRIDFFDKKGLKELHYKTVIYYLKLIGFMYINNYSYKFEENLKLRKKIKDIFKSEIRKYSKIIKIPFRNKIQFELMMKFPKLYKFLRDKIRF